MNFDQLDCFTPDDKHLRKWQIVRQDHPELIPKLADLALKIKARGHKHWSIDALFHVLRFNSALSTATPDDQNLKINNNYTSLASRDLMAEYPELRGFFELRVRKGVGYNPLTNNYHLKTMSDFLPYSEIIDRLDSCYHLEWYLVTDKGAERLDQYQFIPPMKGEDFGEYRHNLSLKEALSTCKHRGYKTIKLGFSHYYLNADCIWPGGYEQPSYYRSNNRVFKEDFKKELFNAELDGPGLMLDPRYISREMLEVIEGLEDYPIINEDDQGSLENDDQEEAWQDLYRVEFISAITKRVDSLLPDNADMYAGDDLVDSFADNHENKLWDLFRAGMEATNSYWIEESQAGWYVDIERVVSGLTDQDLIDTLEIETAQLACC